MKRKVFSIFAAIIFVSGSFSTIISQPVVEESYSCHEYADTWATRLGFWNGWTHEQEHQVYLQLYDECVDSQNSFQP